MPFVERAFRVAERVRSLGYEGAVQTMHGTFSRNEWEVLWCMVEAILRVEGRLSGRDNSVTAFFRALGELDAQVC